MIHCRVAQKASNASVILCFGLSVLIVFYVLYNIATFTPDSRVPQIYIITLEFTVDVFPNFYVDKFAVSTFRQSSINP